MILIQIKLILTLNFYNQNKKYTAQRSVDSTKGISGCIL